MTSVMALPRGVGDACPVHRPMRPSRPVPAVAVRDPRQRKVTAMKWLGTAVVVASLAATCSADAATARPDRSAVMSQCIQLAQRRMPTIISPDDPDARARVDIYSSCMRKNGQRP